MNRFSNIKTDEKEITTATFASRDITEVNLLRRSILSQIETYAIDIVIFHENISPRHDEIIALRLGQLVIDNEKYVPSENKDLRYRLDVQGPGVVTTRDLKDLPFKYVTPIITLKENQRLVCDCIVKKGQAKTHVKWRPISTFTFSESNDGYEIQFKGIGMLSGKSILQKGFEMMGVAAARPPKNLFFKPPLPENFSK